jgi:hypothetical protein
MNVHLPSAGFIEVPTTESGGTGKDFNVCRNFGDGRLQLFVYYR